MAMRIYSALRKAELLRADDAEAGVRFVRDGFSWAAFLVPLVWFIWYRLWRALAIYLVAVIALSLLGYALGLPEGLSFMLATALNLFFGLESGNFRRAALQRQGYQEVADVVAENDEEAAWRFFAQREAGDHVLGV